MKTVLDTWKNLEHIQQQQNNILSHNLRQLLVRVHCENAVKRTDWSCVDEHWMRMTLDLVVLLAFLLIEK
jgi:hypothetical protein